MIEPTLGTAEDFEKLNGELEIDRLKLDEDLQKQPVVFEMVCERAAWANKVLDDANLLLETTEAQTDLATRTKIEASGGKTTEAAVKAMVATDPKVVAAKQAVVQAQHDKLSWQNTRSAYEMRAQSLQDMVKLVVSGYAAYNRK